MHFQLLIYHSSWLKNETCESFFFFLSSPQRKIFSFVVCLVVERYKQEREERNNSFFLFGAQLKYRRDNKLRLVDLFVSLHICEEIGEFNLPPSKVSKFKIVDDKKLNQIFVRDFWQVNQNIRYKLNFWQCVLNFWYIRIYEIFVNL